MVRNNFAVFLIFASPNKTVVVTFSQNIGHLREEK